MSNNTTTARRFSLGGIYQTSGALRTLDHKSVMDALKRHAACDWGNVCPEDKASNDEALNNEGRLVSSYKDSNGSNFWIITEADRSTTTVLLPEEY